MAMLNNQMAVRWADTSYVDGYLGDSGAMFDVPKSTPTTPVIIHHVSSSLTIINHHWLSLNMINHYSSSLTIINHKKIL
jgi:hypothetical protein